jgi:hypothetical protein
VAVVKFLRDPVEVFGAVDAQVGDFLEVLVQQAIRVFVDAALPGECGSQK